MIKVPGTRKKTQDRQSSSSSKCYVSDKVLKFNENGSTMQILPSNVWVTDLSKQLLLASSRGDQKEVKKLMAQGAPFTADWLGTSSLHLAAQNNHLEVCKVLMQSGISKDVRTKVDRTPLHLAAYEGHGQIVECLLNYGAKIDCIDMLGMTPLHWAVQNDHTDVVSMLIDRGAEPDVINKFQLAPLDIAKQIENEDMINTISYAVIKKQKANTNLEEANDSSNDSGLEPAGNQDAQSEYSFPIETILLEDTDEDRKTNYSNYEHGSNILNALFSKPTTSEMLVTDIDDNDPIDSEEIVKNDDMTNCEMIEEKQDFAETVKLLQQHGITMLPPDDSSIFTSVMNTGHQVVLTEIGKEMLKSTKPMEDKSHSVTVVPNKVINKPVVNTTKQNMATVALPMPKIIKMTAEEFLAMTNGVKKQDLPKTTKIVNKNVTATKNQTLPLVINNKNVDAKDDNLLSKKILLTELTETKRKMNFYKRQAETYKSKLLKAQAEAKMYKEQLNSLLQTCDY